MTQSYFYHCIKCYLQTDSISVCPNGLDENLLLKCIREHRLDLLFVHLFKDSGNQELRARLIKHTYKYIIRNQIMMKMRLLELSFSFNNKMIQHVVLKGISLNAQLYGDRSVRISKDIDVLIHSKDLLIAHDALLLLGYELVSELSPSVIANSHSLILGALKDLTYFHSSDRVEVELHWDTTIVKDFGLRLQDVEPVNNFVMINDQFIPVLSNEINFIYLCIHGASCHWQRLQCLLDIAMFYKKMQLSWPEVIRAAVNYNGVRALLEAKYLLDTCFDFRMESVPSLRRDRIAVRIHLYYTKYIWKNLKPINSAVAQSVQLFLFPHLYQKYDFIRNRLLFRFPCRQRLIKNPRYPIFLLLLIGVFSFKRAPLFMGKKVE